MEKRTENGKNEKKALKNSFFCRKAQ